jgi:PKD domain
MSGVVRSKVESNGVPVFDNDMTTIKPFNFSKDIVLVLALTLVARITLAGANPICPDPNPPRAAIQYSGATSACTQDIASPPCVAGEVITFIGFGGANPPCPTEYQWNFGDGSNTSGVISNFGILTHRFTSGGTFTVHFTVVTPSGRGDAFAPVIVSSPAVPVLNSSLLFILLCTLAMVGVIRASR